MLPALVLEECLAPDDGPLGPDGAPLSPPSSGGAPSSSSSARLEDSARSSASGASWRSNGHRRIYYRLFLDSFSVDFEAPTGAEARREGDENTASAAAAAAAGAAAGAAGGTERAGSDAVVHPEGADDYSARSTGHGHSGRPPPPGSSKDTIGAGTSRSTSSSHIVFSHASSSKAAACGCGPSSLRVSAAVVDSLYSHHKHLQGEHATTHSQLPSQLSPTPLALVSAPSLLSPLPHYPLPPHAFRTHHRPFSLSSLSAPPPRPVSQRCFASSTATGPASSPRGSSGTPATSSTTCCPAPVRTSPHTHARSDRGMYM